jgi:hypothetical protein
MMNGNPLDFGIQLQEILAVKHGIKPLLRTVMKPEFVDGFERFCANNNLLFMKKPFSELFGTSLDPPILMVYVSKSKEMIDKGHQADKTFDRKLLGEVLGYPDCCVEFFLDNANAVYPAESFRKTIGKPSYYANNVMKMESRLNSERLKIYQQDIGFGTRTSNLFLISHVPCSYTCKKSMEIGRNVLSLIEKESPEFAGKLVGTLKRPFLFFDDFNWMIFDGKIKNDTLTYASILPPASMLPESLIKKFREGDASKVGKKSIEIFKDGKIVHVIEKKHESDGILLDFS